MFKLVTEHRKRRVWTLRTVAASVAVHALLAAGFVGAAEPKARPVEPDTAIRWFPVEPLKAVTPTPPPPAAQPDKRQPAKPQPAKGQTVEPPAPETVPRDFPPPNPDAPPLPPEHVTGVGRLGAVHGPPDPNPTLPTGSTAPGSGGENLPRWDDVPYVPSEVDSQPELTNKRQAEMILQRSYPPLLRDVGAVGRTTVMLIIDKDGNVEPGSVRVQETTHDAFKDAAVRAVERFRFKPARLKGRNVAVLVTLPIEWRLEN